MPTTELTKWDRIAEVLDSPFRETILSARPGSKSGDTAQILFYIDARAAQQRLDEAAGKENWDFTIEPMLMDGRVVVKGRLGITDGDRYVWKEDIGEAGKEDEPWKSAVSDALKRCAVQFGVGAFLYKMPRFYWPLNANKTGFSNGTELERFLAKVAMMLDEVGGDPNQLDLPALKKLIPSTASAPRAAAAPVASAPASKPAAPSNPPASSASKPVASSTLLISDAQLRCLREGTKGNAPLIEKLGDETAQTEFLVSLFNTSNLEELTRKQTSELMDKLFSM